MTTTRIKEKISQIVASQLPEFIQNDYSTFVLFLEYYYKFIEQDQGAHELLQNARLYSDIDSTIPSFIQYFLSEYAKDIPTSVLTDKKLLVKKISDLYEAKGSELSFKLLFRIMFDQSVAVTYPYENVLRASVGKWQQKVSLFLETVSGDRNYIQDKSLYYISNSVEFSTQIINTKQLTDSLTEVFLNINQIAPSYTVGDLVYVYNGNSLVYTGRIRPTTVGYSILTSGTGFRIGQIFNITSGAGFGTLIKVVALTANNGIEQLQFINYGYGYTGTANVFNIDLDASKNISETNDIFVSKLQGFGSSGTVELIGSYNEANSERYFQEIVPNNYTDYTDPTFPYVGISSLTTFNNTTYSAPEFFASAKPESTATIQFRLGALAKYPGSYFKNDGFISEADVRLEDNKLYQPFAYLTNTELDVSEFFSFVKKLIHPAGQNLFNNRLVSVDLDFSSNVQTFSQSNVFTELRDVFNVAANSLWTLNKPISNETEIQDEITVELLPFTITDEVNVVDDIDYELGQSRVLSAEETDLQDSTILQVGNEINNETNIVDSGSVSSTGVSNPDRYFDTDYDFEYYTELAVVATF